MGMIRYDTASTFTGYIADETHSLDWLFAVPGGEEPDPSLIPEAAVLVMGSTTYTWVLDHTGARDDPRVGADRLTLIEARAVGAFARVRFRVAPGS